MKNSSKRSLQLAIAVVATLFGIALIITAFWVPPMGVIDPTVLTAYGETLTFVGALVGIDYRYRGDTSPGLRPPPSQRDGGREEENGGDTSPASVARFKQINHKLK